MRHIKFDDEVYTCRSGKNVFSTIRIEDVKNWALDNLPPIIDRRGTYIRFKIDYEKRIISCDSLDCLIDGCEAWITDSMRVAHGFDALIPCPDSVRELHRLLIEPVAVRVEG